MDNCNECICCLCNKIKLLSLQMANCASSITVGTVTTLPAGSQVTVTNVGTPSNVVLNFGIPRGENGNDGLDGATPVSVTSKGTNPITGGNMYTLDFSDGNSYAFEAPKGDKGKDGKGCDVTTMHIWLETALPTYTVKGSESFFGISEPKDIAFSSIQGSNIPNFTSAGGMIKVNTTGTYLVTYQFVVKGNKCDVRIRRNNSDIPGGNIKIINTTGEILVSGTMIYTVTPNDLTISNNVFDIANGSNVDLVIDPKSFCWSATQLNTNYDQVFARIPFN